MAFVLWIALHLPQLSIESFAAAVPGAASEPALALLLDAHCIKSANRVALALGVKPGMKRATALMLAPHLVLGEAEPTRDAEALMAVAHAALGFTPQVVVPMVIRAAACSDAEGTHSGSTHPGSTRTRSSRTRSNHTRSSRTRNTIAKSTITTKTTRTVTKNIVLSDDAHTVLLEVEGSLRYFGGREALLQRLFDTLAPLGHQMNAVSAPTPHAAALLARVNRRLHCTDILETRRALEAAPMWLVGQGRHHEEALQGMGLRTLSDLTCLPRSGISRRFGPALLDELDRALGILPDPREPIVLPPVFESRLELFTRADTAEQLLRGAGVLLARLVVWLAARHAFVRRFSLWMDHERHRRSDLASASTCLEIALSEPSRDASHLLSLLRERLAPLQLPAPTLELRMQASDIACRAPPNGELFPTPRSEREGLVRLMERLQARLGREHILRLVAVPDHRPEHANLLQPVSAPPHPEAEKSPPVDAVRPALQQQPVWLLDKPELLSERGSKPLLGGHPLELLSGPERIEAGWWDGGLAERDYFIAQTVDGALVWIYRARLQMRASQPGWFLHGRFG